MSEVLSYQPEAAEQNHEFRTLLLSYLYKPSWEHQHITGEQLFALYFIYDSAISELITPVKQKARECPTCDLRTGVWHRKTLFRNLLEG